jgi:predicted transcriptional regulator
MATQRITITLPSEVAGRLRLEAKEKRKPVSRLIAEALAAQEAERIRQRMIEGYKECAELNRQLAEEFWPISVETWPDD